MPVFVRDLTASRPRDESYASLRELVARTCDLKWSWSSGQLLPPRTTRSRAEPYDGDFDRVVTVLETPRGELTHERLVGRRGQPGMTRKHWLAGRDDAHKYLSLPLREPQGDAESFFALTREVGERGIVEVGLPSMNPAGTVAELFGSERFALLSIEDRGLLLELCERETQGLVRVVEWLLARGVGPYFASLGQEYVAPPLHGPGDFWELNVRFDRRVYGRIREAGGIVHVHCHGGLAGLLEGFVEMGASVLHPVEAPPMGNVTAGEAKAVLAGRVCIEGNIQIGDLLALEPAAIERQVVELIRDAGQGGGLIVCPTASPYQPVCPERTRLNYERMIQTVLDAG